MTTQEITIGFRDYQLALNRSQSRVDWQVVLLKRFLAFIASRETSVSQVDEKVLIEYQYYVSQLKNRKGNNYCITAQNDHLTTVKKLYRYLKIVGHVLNDPTSYIEYSRAPQQLPRDIISVDQMFDLLNQPDTTTVMGRRDLAAMELLYSSGIRRAELLGLNIQDVDFSRRMIRVTGKGRVDRVVPFGKTAARAMHAWLDKGRAFYMRDPEEQAFFLSIRGLRWSTMGVLFAVRKHAKSAGIEHMTVHTFRHCCATHLLDSGMVDVRLIQELLGHTKLSTTAKYLRVSATRLKQIHSQYHPREVN